MLFGDVRTSSTELAQKLCHNVRDAVSPLGARTSDRNWTYAVKQVLNQEGKRFDYEVWCSGIEGSCEWLLDVIWWKKRETGIGIALAVECEWGARQEVIEDFQKLLCIKAPLKVLIYDGGNIPEHGAEVRAAIEREMQAYHHHVTGETYLFLGFGNVGQYCHRVVVSQDGMVKAVKFELLTDIQGTSKATLA